MNVVDYLNCGRAFIVEDDVSDNCLSASEFWMCKVLMGNFKGDVIAMYGNGVMWF